MKILLLRLLALRPDRTLLRLAAALAFLAAATAWVEWGMDRLVPLPGAAALRPLADAPGAYDFALDPRPGFGRATVERGAAVLESPREEGIVALYLHLAPIAELAGLRVAARLSSASVTGAREPGAGARLWLFGRDRERRPVYGRGLELVRLVGSREPFAFQRDLRLPHGSAGATLALELVRARGRVEIADLAILPLRESPLFGLARAAVVVGWLVLGGVALILFARHLGAPVSASAVGAAVVGAGLLLLLPAPLRDELLGALALRLGPEGTDPETLGDLGHLLLFAGLGSFALVALRAVAAWKIVGVLLLAALLAEYLQLLSDSRTPDWGDALRNVLGVGSGAALGVPLRRLRARDLDVPIRRTR
ncbi:MAG: hypothetical protein NZ704_08660 [Geminicoccaceae bacterium]|nr:hypothetical protein [Geminicoccaceae bacterium]